MRFFRPVLFFHVCLVLGAPLEASEPPLVLEAPGTDPLVSDLLIDEMLCEEKQEVDCQDPECKAVAEAESCLEAAEFKVFCDDLADKNCLKKQRETQSNPASGLKLLEAACKANPEACEN